MSNRTGTERPKLKARRFNKFESTSAENEPQTSVHNTIQIIKRQGLKRPCDEVNVYAPKKFCSGVQEPPNITKNLANNRLQRLKHSLKKDLDQKHVPDKKTGESMNQFTGPVSEVHLGYNELHSLRTSADTNIYLAIPTVETTTENTANLRFHSERESNSIKMQHVEPVKNSRQYNYSQTTSNPSFHCTSRSSHKNIYQNLDKWANPSDKYPVKNLANQRLNRLKRVVNDLNSSVEYSSSSNNCRTPLDDKLPFNSDIACIDLDRGTGIQRIVDSGGKEMMCSPINNSVATPISSLTSSNNQWTHNSPLLRTKSSCNPNIDKRSEYNFSSPESSNKNTLKPSPKVSNNKFSPFDNTCDKYPVMNLANQRLNRLKRVVNDMNHSVEYSSSNNHCRTSEEDKLPFNSDREDRISGIKRNTCRSDQERDVICSPIKKSFPSPNSSLTTPNNQWTQTSPLLRTKSSCLSNVDSTNFSSSESSNKSTLKTSPNVSNRIMKIKRNMETMNNTSYDETVIESKPYSKPNEYSNHKKEAEEPVLGHDCFKKPPTESEGIKLNRKASKSTNRNTENASKSNSSQKTTPHRNESNVSQSNSQLNDTNLILKPHLKSPKPQDPTSPSMIPTEADNCDNYKGKWKMTAAWIWNHQNINGTPDQLVGVPETVVEPRAEPIYENRDRTDDMEEMEWTNAEPDNETVEEPQKNIETNSAEKEEPNGTVEDEKSKKMCIVVDTNVFISGLSKVKDIMNLKITGPISPIIYVPWMVITELDYMKHSCSDDKLKQKVTSAIKFINTALENKNSRFLGQTIHDMEKQKSIGISPDDKIVSCCLQATEKYETVILLSNDLNLRSKAMINNISATSANEVLMKILSKTTRTVKANKVMQKMSMLCSSVICECAKETFGDVWSKMDLLSNPPWSLKECLKRFRKYWPTVFQDKVMKQFTMAVDQLLAIFRKNRHFADDSEDYISFMKLCVNLCIFLKDINQCRGSVENTLRDITKI